MKIEGIIPAVWAPSTKNQIFFSAAMRAICATGMSIPVVVTAWGC